MTIRKARKGEKKAIRALIATEPEELEQRRSMLPRRKDFIVAVKGGKLVGCGAVAKDGRRLELRCFVVLPAYRHNGIATRLLKACLRLAIRRARRRKGKYELMVTTGKPKFFQQVGFRSTNDRKHFALFLTL